MHSGLYGLILATLCTGSRVMYTDTVEVYPVAEQVIMYNSFATYIEPDQASTMLQRVSLISAYE